MSTLPELSAAAAVLSCFGLTLVSGVVPWVNAEVIVLALPAVARTPGMLACLVLVATAGQMAGKCFVYWVGRGGTGLASARVAATTARWRDRLARCRINPLVLVLVSSTIGMPPFYAMTMVAGALRLSFPCYVALGTIGRLLRFSGLVLAAEGLTRLVS